MWMGRCRDDVETDRYGKRAECEALPVLLAFLLPFSELLGVWLPIFLVLQGRERNHCSDEHPSF